VAFETVFTFLDVRWSLGSKDTGDVDGVSGRGTDTVKVRDKSGANCSIGEVSFHHVEFALSTIFPLIELNSLALYRLKFALMCPISVDVSNNTRILEIDNGIVDEESGSGGRMKNVEVVIFDPRAIEVGGGMCMCVEGDRELGFPTLVSPYKMSIDPDLSEGDVMCHLVLSVLVEEDKQILPHITAVIFAPSDSWMVWVVKLMSELRNIGNGARCGREGDGGVVLSESDWFIALYIVV